MAVCIARVSVATLLLRIIGFSAWRRWTLYACIASTFLIGSVYSITTFLQCDPISVYWNFSQDHKCWDVRVESGFAIGTSGEFLRILPGISCGTDSGRKAGMALSTFVL